MRPLIIFGATSGVGLELARRERASGRPVVAMVRPETDPAHLQRLGVTVLPGSAMNRADVERVFASMEQGFDVVSTLGGRATDGRLADDEGNINVIEAAAASGRAQRFVFVTSIGCGEMAPFRSERAIAAFGAAVDAKTRAENVLRATELRWTIVRPGGLRSDSATGNGVLTADIEMHGFIQRADVAALVSRALRDVATERGVFAAVDRDAAQSIHPLSPFPLQEEEQPA